jgi:hypothetical protein
LAYRRSRSSAPRDCRGSATVLGTDRTAGRAPLRTASCCDQSHQCPALA